MSTQQIDDTETFRALSKIDKREINYSESLKAPSFEKNFLLKNKFQNNSTDSKIIRDQFCNKIKFEGNNKKSKERKNVKLDTSLKDKKKIISNNSDELNSPFSSKPHYSNKNYDLMNNYKRKDEGKLINFLKIINIKEHIHWNYIPDAVVENFSEKGKLKSDLFKDYNDNNDILKDFLNINNVIKKNNKKNINIDDYKQRNHKDKKIQNFITQKLSNITIEPKLIQNRFISPTIYNKYIKYQEESINLNFTIPDNFLTEFDLISVSKIIQPNKLNEEGFEFYANYEHFEKFINKICNIVISNNTNNNFIHISGNNYVKKTKKIFQNNKRKDEIKKNVFLNKKRRRKYFKNENYFIKSSKKQNKKKNKINEDKKDGLKKEYDLNQIIINKNHLLNFPFYKIEDNKITEILKVKLLNGLTVRKDILQVKNKKSHNILINKRYINNKIYKIKYRQIINNEYFEYNLYVTSYYIIYIIFYYYFIFRKILLRINQYFYSHINSTQLYKLRDSLSCLISKCNAITNSIKK